MIERDRLAILRLDGATNMRLDAELLEAAERGTPGWRVYCWAGVWVSVGRFESVERDLVDPEHTRWVRRPTGGKAVLHGHDTTIGCALPLSMLASSDHRSIKSVYRAIVGPVVVALRVCGLDAELAEDTPFHGKGIPSGDCFAFSSPNDVVHRLTGRKLCGCALRLTDSAVLLQASIPNGAPLVEPASVIVNADLLDPVEWDDRGLEQALAASLGVS